MKKWLFLVPLAVGAASNYESVRRKLDSIESDRLAAGTRLELTLSELNAYVEKEVLEAVPAGVRNPRLELGRESATGSALVDFAKLRRAQGKPPGWLMGRLLEGERPVRVTAVIRSSMGMATVDLRSVEISGMAIEGAMLDFLIDNFLLPMYPEAAIGKPFELKHNIERLEVRPGGVGVLIGGAKAAWHNGGAAAHEDEGWRSDCAGAAAGERPMRLSWRRGGDSNPWCFGSC